MQKIQAALTIPINYNEDIPNLLVLVLPSISARETDGKPRDEKEELFVRLSLEKMAEGMLSEAGGLDETNDDLGSKVDKNFAYVKDANVLLDVDV